MTKIRGAKEAERFLKVKIQSFKERHIYKTYMTFYCEFLTLELVEDFVAQYNILLQRKIKKVQFKSPVDSYC